LEEHPRPGLWGKRGKKVTGETSPARGIGGRGPGPVGRRKVQGRWAGIVKIGNKKGQTAVWRFVQKNDKKRKGRRERVEDPLVGRAKSTKVHIE